MKKIVLTFLAGISIHLSVYAISKINRYALVERNNPHVTAIKPLNSLTIGNGCFAFTVDATGLQSFPDYYKDGLSLGTYSEWGWHSFPNTQQYKIEETLENRELPGHSHGLYAVQFPKGPERNAKASEWFRSNPHRLHLGNIGFTGISIEDLSQIDQTLDMWRGEIHSKFNYKDRPMSVITTCNAEKDIIAVSISSENKLAVSIHFPYPTGLAADDGSNWNADNQHSTAIVLLSSNRAIIKRTIDATVYYVEITWKGKVKLVQSGRNQLTLKPSDINWSFNVGFYKGKPIITQPSYLANQKSSNDSWKNYWETSGVIDFSNCKDKRAPLLERRIVLSQYLLNVQETQNFPPAETGLTYNTWYGKFHLEMVMWHIMHFAVWNKESYVESILKWYKKAMPIAKLIAERQGFKGIRWMKMTDPSGKEAPSDVGSFIIWQQPHVIYMAELVYRATHSNAFLKEYYDMIEQTAEFMASFVNYDASKDRYIIQGACAANEAYNESTTINPAFEMAYWYYGLSVAQQWRERMGKERNTKWEEIRNKLAPLASSPEGIYLPAEKGKGIPDFENGIPAEKLPEMPEGGFINGQRPIETQKNKQVDKSVVNEKHNPFYVSATSSENLLAFGMLPESPLININKMKKTLQRAVENWNWTSGSWSWNYPSLAMNATRLYQPEIALRAITMDNRDDLLLPSGNNYRTTRLRSYLPGNGGLLLAVSMMCAGWDGCTEVNPGFPKDGNWDVQWEGLRPMP